MKDRHCPASTFLRSIAVEFRPMMRRRLAFVSLALLAATGLLGAQTPAEQESRKALEVMDFLVGQWGNESSQWSYGWTLGGKFIEMRLVNEGGRTVLDAWHFIGVDPATGKVTLWEFTTETNPLRLTQAAGTASGVARFEGRYRHGGGRGPLRLTLKRDAGQLVQELEHQHEGKWESLPMSIPALPAGARLFEAPQPEGPAKGAPVAALEKLVGTWRVEGESEGTRYAVEYAIRWAMQGHFLRSEYRVTTGGKTELHAISLFGYDPESQGLVQTGFSADGSVMTGKVRLAGEEVIAEGEMVSPTRRTLLRVTYSRPDADTLSARTEMQRQGTWRSSGVGSFRRVR